MVDYKHASACLRRRSAIEIRKFASFPEKTAIHSFFLSDPEEVTSCSVRTWEAASYITVSSDAGSWTADQRLLARRRKGAVEPWIQDSNLQLFGRHGMVGFLRTTCQYYLLLQGILGVPQLGHAPAWLG
jgi:hypothetical protein